MLLRRRAWDLAAGLQEAAAAGLLAGAGAELAFADFEIEDLNPRRFAQKHLSGDLNADQRAQRQSARQATPNGALLTPGKSPGSPTGNENEKQPG